MKVDFEYEVMFLMSEVFFFSSRRRHTRCGRDWSSDVCSSDLGVTRSRTVATLPQPTASVTKRRPAVTELNFGDKVLFAEDRKSTRLNSSHVRISYAVFCLKKKKNIYSEII